jgi:hypothetical protein
LGRGKLAYDWCIVHTHNINYGPTVDYPYEKLWDGYLGAVYVFERALREIYREAVNALYKDQPERARKLLSEVGDSFQRLEGAEAAFRHFNYELLGCLTARERDELELIFMKRHALERRREWLSWWDYYVRVRPLPFPRLFRVSLNLEEMQRGQELVDRVMTAAKNTLFKPKR